MSVRRSWLARLSGGRTVSATQPPPSRPEPGPMPPVRIGPPERTRPPGPGPRAGPAVPEPPGPALRVVLVSRDNMLAGALRSLIEAPGGVRMLDWHADELGVAIRHADVVIVDMPPSLHQRTFAVIDGRFLGRTVVLLQAGEHAEALPPGPPRVVLYRPLQIGELWAAIIGWTPPPADPPPEPAAIAPEAAGPKPDPVPEPQGRGPEHVGREDPEAGVAGSASPGSDEPEPDSEVADDPDPEPGVVYQPEFAADDRDPAAEVPGDAAEVRQPVEGMPVSESGRLIGLSGRELEPVVGPGQIAPGMDEATLERLRRWGNRSRQLAQRQNGPGRSERRRAKDEARRAKAVRAEAGKAARAESRQARVARAEARRAESRQARAARGEARAAAREEAARAKAARVEAGKVARAESRQARAARAEARKAARAESRQARAVRAEARAAAREEAARAKAARVEAGKAARAAAREEAARAKAVRVEAGKAARAESRQARVARAEGRRAESRQARVARGAARAAAREEAARTKAARVEARKAAQAESRQARAVRKAARAESRQARAARAEARRAESRQARAARGEARRVARAEAGRARSARAETRREEAMRAKAARSEARKEAELAKAARAEEAERAKAARAEEAGLAKAARAEEAERARVARAAARAEAGRARAARVEARAAARAEAGRARAAARAEAGRARAARAEARWAKVRAEVVPWGAVVVRRVLSGVARPAVVVVTMAVVGLAAAGWRGDGGPDTLAGEVAAVRAAGPAGDGLVVQDPRIGPIEPLHALAVGAWLRATGAKDSLEAAVRAARVPSRVLLAVTVALTVLLSLLLMRVGPGTGAAAGPGPAPPHGRPARVWRLGVAGLVGALVALDPVLVRGGRVATGTVFALALALGTLALAWALPPRPALRWLAPVAAGSGLALLASPLALPVLAVPTAAALLAGRHREAWRTLAALGLGAALWLVLPIWVAGQDLGAGQAGWLLGRPPGRGSLAASLAAFPLSWLLVVAGLAAAILPWRHRSGARAEPRDQTATTRLLAWVGTTAAGALLAMGLGYPIEQALPFALPAAAVALAFVSGWAVTALRGNGSSKGRQVALAGVGVALVGLLAAQGVDWGQRYGERSDDGLGRLVATVADQVPDCSAINAGGPDDRARLLDAGAKVTDFSSGPAAHAAGVRYFVLTPDAARYGGPTTPTLASWVRENGGRLAEHPSPSFSRVELWRVDADPLDPVADNLPVPGGIFSNVTGSACGGYRVVDGPDGAFHTAYSALGGKAVLGRPLGSVWTSDGPALQAFDTMVLGAAPAPTGQPTVRPIELPPLLAKLDAEAVADAGIPLPSARAPASDAQARTLLNDRVIARAYLGTDPATASADDWRRAGDRFGRPLGMPQVMPDGAVRQPFERVVLELPADGGPPRLASLGRLAVRLGLVPRQARQLEPVPGLPARSADTRVEPGPLLRLVAAGLALLALGTGVGALAARRARQTQTGEDVAGR